MTSKFRIPELGVDKPCFGRFKCGVCSWKWISCKAWKNFGQQCKACVKKQKAGGDVEVLPTGLEPLFYYCCLDCKPRLVWKYKWEQNGMKCRGCQQLKFPLTAKQFKLYWIPKLEEKPKDLRDHKEELCEKCKFQGRNCSVDPRIKLSDGLVKVMGELANLRLTEENSPLTAPTAKDDEDDDW